MKKQDAKIDKMDNVNKSKKSFLRLNNVCIGLCVLTFSLLVFMSACSPEMSSEEGFFDANESKTDLARKSQNAEEIEENIRNSYARLAARRDDVCPKLIQEEIGSNVIERTAEVMRDDYCDYFLYPRSGQDISVKVNDSQIEALLIVPMLHNFANGDYQVKSYDKHVIRLAYNGIDYKPENLTYDVEVTVVN
ncbi:hypothetical protein AAJP47_07245 [Psychrobacter sp. B38]|uniref:hypothetical protein n=1 Tax=Psychrobacter sp. B38 TaxID=3143538 RepID=UPI00320F0FF2